MVSLNVLDRSGAWTEEEVLRLGREAGEQLKAEAGPEFFGWLDSGAPHAGALSQEHPATGQS